MNTTAVAANVVTVLQGAGKVSKDEVVAVLVGMCDVLQASYKGRLAIMVPRSPSTVSPRWMTVYAWQIVELCDRHGRTETQVMEALTTVLAK